MRDFLLDLTKALTEICPAFLHLPPETPYPYITIEPVSSLQGLPWGPTIITLTIKIWSRYTGTHEILKLARSVEKTVNTYKKSSLKIIKSALTLRADKKTRVHTIHLQARVTSDE